MTFQREKNKIIQNLSKRIKSGDHVNIVSLPGMGIQHVIIELKTKVPEKQWIEIDCNMQADHSIDELIQMIRNEIDNSEGSKILLLMRPDRTKKFISANFLSAIRSLCDQTNDSLTLIICTNRPLFNLTPKTVQNHLTYYAYTQIIPLFTEKELLDIVRRSGRKISARNIVLSGGHYHLAILLETVYDGDILSVEDLLKSELIALFCREQIDYLSEYECRLVRDAYAKQSVEEIHFLRDIGFMKVESEGELRVYSKIVADYLFRHGLITELTKLEKRLLAILTSNQHRIVTSQEVKAYVWKNTEKELTSDWALATLIHRLRKNPVFAAKGRKIINIKKQGYKII